MPNPAQTLQLVRREILTQLEVRPTTRYEYRDNLHKRPLLLTELEPAAYSAAAQRILLAANPNLFLTGVNMTSALSTFSPGGGVNLATAGANGDQAIVSPMILTGPINATSIAGTTGAPGATSSPWLTSKSIRMRAVVSLGLIATTRFIMGFKLTNSGATALAPVTDNNAAFFSFDTASPVSATSWRCVTNVAAALTDVVASQRNSPDTLVQANTNYVLEIRIDGRIPTFLINDNPVGSGPQITDAITLQPVIGVQGLGAAAPSFALRHLRISRLY